MTVTVGAVGDAAVVSRRGVMVATPAESTAAVVWPGAGIGLAVAASRAPVQAEAANAKTNSDSFCGCIISIVWDRRVKGI